MGNGFLFGLICCFSLLSLWCLVGGCFVAGMGVLVTDLLVASRGIRDMWVYSMLLWRFGL